MVVLLSFIVLPFLLLLLNVKEVVIEIVTFYIFICPQEAKQALELMGKWEMIDVSDALELLSPAFESEEVICTYILAQSNVLLDTLNANKKVTFLSLILPFLHLKSLFQCNGKF